VRRGAEHAERGVRTPDGMSGSAGTSPSPRPGAPGFPFGVSGASSPGRRDGGH
jgi:hypothetical protein